MTLYPGIRTGTTTRSGTTQKKGTTRPRSFFSSYPLGGTTSPTTSRARQFPERVQAPDVWTDPEGAAVSSIGHIIQTPAAAWNRPLGFVDYVTHQQQQGAETDPIEGAVKGFLGQIGQISLGSKKDKNGQMVEARVADIFGGANKALQAEGNFTSALTNSQDHKLLAAGIRAGISDDTVLSPRQVAALIPNDPGTAAAYLGLGAFLGNNRTWGDFKANLEKRGFNLDAAGNVLSWEDVAQRGDFDFGDKPVNESELADMAYRFGTDPLNFALGAAMVGRGARAVSAAEAAPRIGPGLANWARPRGSLIGIGDSIVKPSSYGVGLVDDLARQGVRQFPLLSPAASATAIRGGQFTQISLKGLGLAMRASRAVFLPGPTALERRLLASSDLVPRSNLLANYTRGAMRMQIGGLAVQYGSGALANTMEENGIPGSGIMRTIHDTAEGIMNDNPLADEPLFVMLAAFKAPAPRVVAEDIRAIRGHIRGEVDPNARVWANRLYEDTHGRKPGLREKGQAEQALYDHFGGKEGFARLLEHIDLRIAFQRYTAKHPGLHLTLGAFDELVYGAGTMRSILDGDAAHLRNTYQTNATLRLQVFEDWAREHRGEAKRDENGDVVTDRFGLPVYEKSSYGYADLPFASLLEDWAHYEAVNKGLMEAFEPVSGVVLGEQSRMSKEGLVELRRRVQEVVDDGGDVPTDFVRSQLVKFPAMLDDPSVNVEFWRSLLNLGVAAGKGIHKGSKPRTYDSAEIIAELDKLIEDAPTQYELFHEPRLAEEAANPPPVHTNTFLRRGGQSSRKLSSIGKVEQARILSDQTYHSLRADVRKLRAFYESRWSKDNQLKAAPKLRRQAPKMMEYTLDPAHGGGTFDAMTGTPKEYKTGYSVGYVNDTFAYISPGDVAGLTEASIRIHAEYPRANIGTWLNDATGRIEVDPSIYIMDQAEAMAQAKARNQKAIYDYATGESIPNPDYAPPVEPEVQAAPIWQHPGPAPEYRLPDEYKPDNEAARAKALEWYAQYHAKDRVWQKKMGEGVAIGAIPAEEATAAGWKSNARGDTTPLPEGPLYHATGSVSGIMEKGLLTRDEIGSTGLGGGPDETISFTTKKELADRIAETLIEAHDVLIGKITPDDLLARAEAQGFGDEFRKVMSVQADPANGNPAAFERMYHQGLHLVRAEFGKAPKLSELPEGSIPDEKSVIGGDYREFATPEQMAEYMANPDQQYYAWWEPMTPEQAESRYFNLYRDFLTHQQTAGGPENPLFFSPDLEALKRLDPNDVGVVEATANSGAQGYQVGSMNEWRTWSGDAVSIKGREPPRPELAAESGQLANRGTEPARIRPATQTLDEIRLGEQVEMKAKTAEMKRIKAEQRALEASVAQYRTIKLNFDELDSHGHPTVQGDGLNLMREITDWVNHESWAYQAEMGPRVHVPWKPEDGPIAALMADRSALATVLFDYGPIARMTQFIEHLTQPQMAGHRARDGRQMVANYLRPLGFTDTEVTDIFTALHERREQQMSFEVRGTKYSVARTIQALSPSDTNAVFRAAVSGNPEALARFDALYKGRFDHILDRSLNSLTRRIELRVLKGQKTNRFEKLVKSGYWAWQDTPGLSQLADGTRIVSKFLYPLIRFTIDPRWLVMNYIEADIIALGQDGWFGTRMAPSRETPITQRAFDVMENRSERSIPLQREGMSPSQSLNEANLETGSPLLNQTLNRVARQQHAIRMAEATRQILDSIPENGSVFQTMVERFGPNEGTWAEQLDAMQFGFDSKGVGPTVMAEFQRIAKEDGWTAEEMTSLRPLMRALTDIHQKTYDDLMAIHVGNPNRSIIERTLNSYWLYWPLSYQIKATKWLVGVLADRAGGRQSNLGGLWTVNRLYEEFQQQVNSSPSFQQQLKDDDLIWFTMGMMLPVTPFDLGVSLNRGVRYLGGNALPFVERKLGVSENDLFRVWPEYDMTPGDMLLKLIELGPFYTINLLDRLANHPFVKGLFKEQPVDDGSGGYTPPE